MTSTDHFQDQSTLGKLFTVVHVLVDDYLSTQYIEKMLKRGEACRVVAQVAKGLRDCVLVDRPEGEPIFSFGRYAGRLEHRPMPTLEPTRRNKFRV